MKKPSVTSFLIAFLLAAAVCTHGQEEEVKDSNGNPVKVGEKYFIQPVKTESNPGGGLIPYPIKPYQTCPLGITEALYPNQPGVSPVSFQYPFAIGRDTIDTSSYISIELRPRIWPVCTEFSRWWAVDYSSPATKEPAIIIGGRRDNPTSAFKMEKVRGVTYKLATFYGTVGTTPGAFSGAPQLIVTNDEAKTLFVKFVKADDDATTATTTSRVEKLGLRMFPFNIM